MTGIIYHNPSEIITQLIVDALLADYEDTGTGDPASGWNIFPIHLPESPDRAIVVKDTAGRLHRRSNPTGVTGEHYGVQILVRSGVSPQDPFIKLKRIMEYFDSYVNRDDVTLNDAGGTSRSYRIHATTRTSPILPAGNDGRRFFFSANLITSIELI